MNESSDDINAMTTKRSGNTRPLSHYFNPVQFYDLSNDKNNCETIEEVICEESNNVRN